MEEEREGTKWGLSLDRERREEDGAYMTKSPRVGLVLLCSGMEMTANSK